MPIEGPVSVCNYLKDNIFVFLLKWEDILIWNYFPASLKEISLEF